MVHHKNSNLSTEGINIKTSKIDWAIFYFALICLGHSDTSDYAIYAIITTLLLSRIKSLHFSLYYIPLIFFEKLIELPFKNSSYFIIFQIIFLIHIYCKGINFNFKGDKLAISWILFFIATSLLDFSLIGFFSMTINLLIILNIKSKLNNLIYLNKLLITISTSILLSGFYGIAFIPPINYGFAERYSAIIGDPNYSAFFYVVGFFSTIGAIYSRKIIKLLALITHLLLILSTVSISGIIGLLSLGFIFLLYTSNKKFIAKITLMASTVIFICYFFLYDILASKIGIINRLSMIKNDRSQGINDLTSGRSEFSIGFLNKFSDGSILEIIFGGRNITQGAYADQMKLSIGNVSHNAYIDALYQVGVIGVLILLLLLTLSLIKNIQIYNKTKNTAYASIVFIKLTVIYFSFSLSLFPFRYFYFLLII